MAEPERRRKVHESHDPEPEGSRVAPGFHACRRCCRFVGIERAGYRVTDVGTQPCPGLFIRRGAPIPGVLLINLKPESRRA